MVIDGCLNWREGSPKSKSKSKQIGLTVFFVFFHSTNFVCHNKGWCVPIALVPIAFHLCVCVVRVIDRNLDKKVCHKVDWNLQDMHRTSHQQQLSTRHASKASLFYLLFVVVQIPPFRSGPIITYAKVLGLWASSVCSFGSDQQCLGEALSEERDWLTS